MASEAEVAFISVLTNLVVIPTLADTSAVYVFIMYLSCINTLCKLGEMMQFNNDLYWSLADIFPEMTVRSLSRMMGKSDGYWSSVNAQKMAVSNAALVQLLDVLEFLDGRTDTYDAKKKRIDEAKAFITDELIARFHEKTGIDQSGSFQSAKSDPATHYGALPFMVSSY